MTNTHTNNNNNPISLICHTSYIFLVINSFFVHVLSVCVLVVYSLSSMDDGSGYFRR